MLAHPLSLTARTLYAELHSLALAVGASEHLGRTAGSLVRKKLKGAEYFYYQYRDLDGHTRQTYLGPDNPATQALMEQMQTRVPQLESDLARLDELRAAFIAAGGVPVEHTPMRILSAFADAGVLHPGRGCALLVGTYAFNALGNLLGVRWASQMRTQDIDLAGGTNIDIAVWRPDLSAPDVLMQLQMGFIPVPRLDPRMPSTSFRVRGQEMRVDLLAPQIGKPSDKPVFVPALNAVAQPVRFLDYLLQQAVPALIIGRRNLLLVNIPAPQRFALHKLLVSESRSSAFATKSAKDRIQAVQILEVLMQEAPDGIGEAKSDLLSRGKGWAEKLQNAVKKCAKDSPALVEWLEAM